MSSTSLLAFSSQLADVVAGVAPAVVQVQNRRRPLSGLVFAKDLVVTTARVLERDEHVRVRTGDGGTADAEVAGWDPSTSLVVLRVANLAATPAVRADAASRVGEMAVAIARSWSNAVTATAGLVSVIGGPLPIGHGQSIDRVIRTDATMHGGFSGGAFVDMSGKIIGLTTAAVIRDLGVVIPADIVWASATALAEHGTPKRGFLGVTGQPVLLPERNRESADRPHAALVVGIAPGSPAETGGILVGDVIVAFDGQPVSSPVDLLKLLHGDRIGRTVPVRIVRGGAPLELPVIVGDRSHR
jgi:S1-C subfamily serine protease